MLVGNYRADRQQSMLRFGELLFRALPSRGWKVSEIHPKTAAGALLRGGTGGGLGKWLGYIDKYLLFPKQLTRRVREESAAGPLVVHVLDHSNAVYVPARSPRPWVVTCHDLLAVRGALGEATDCPATALGRLLQRRIVRGLGRAQAVASVSESTLGDLTRLVLPRGPQERPVILLSQNHPYQPISARQAHDRLASLPDFPWRTPFLLHIGSNLIRKNKAGILRVFARIADRWPGNLIFCGASLPENLRRQAAQAGVSDRVFAYGELSNSQLEAAYSLAHALIFPSTCEGFGWPIIEAQACGCPVICSDRTSLPEVGGDAALIYPLDDESGMAEGILKLTEPTFRAGVIERGGNNLARFTQDRLVEEYGRVYELVGNQLQTLAPGGPRR